MRKTISRPRCGQALCRRWLRSWRQHRQHPHHRQSSNRRRYQRWRNPRRLLHLRLRPPGACSSLSLRRSSSHRPLQPRSRVSQRRPRPRRRRHISQRQRPWSRRKTTSLTRVRTVCRRVAGGHRELLCAGIGQLRETFPQRGFFGLALAQALCPFQRDRNGLLVFTHKGNAGLVDPAPHHACAK